MRYCSQTNNAINNSIIQRVCNGSGVRMYFCYCNTFIMTCIILFIRKGHLTPSWEECLIFNDRPSLLFHGPNTLILFELLLMTTIPPSTDLPWTCLAWGFLRPSVAMRKKELAKKGAVNWSCWIQLYRPPNLWRRRDRTPQVSSQSCIFAHQSTNF